MGEPTGEGVRVDSGYAAGTTVTPAYDSLMAKLVVHGPDRASTLERARKAVADFTITGPKSNLAFHAELLDNHEFVSGDYDTGIVGRMRSREVTETQSQRGAHDHLHDHVEELRKQVESGGAAKYHEANANRGKLFARERVAVLVDDGSFVEDAAFANVLAGDLPADGVVTGFARIEVARSASWPTTQRSRPARGGRARSRRSSGSSSGPTDAGADGLPR